jgi:uncharacterized protein
MSDAYFRFYADLNDFLLLHLRSRDFAHLIQDGTQSVKHLIESLGVPHTEVELILVNGRSVDFNYLVQAEDRVSVYPPFHTLDVSPLVDLRPLLAPPHRFHFGQPPGQAGPLPAPAGSGYALCE